jgi:hypothetical protein
MTNHAICRSLIVRSLFCGLTTPLKESDRQNVKDKLHVSIINIPQPSPFRQKTVSSWYIVVYSAITSNARAAL